MPANPHTFLYKPPDRESVVIGTWSPTGLDRSRGAAVQLVMCSTDDRETVELWHTELAAGRLPQSTEDVP